MDLKRIGANNFLGYKSMAVEVEPGLTLIDGVNHHFATASSGGSGKSSLEEVLAFSMFGETMRGLAMDDVIREGRDWAAAWSEFGTEEGGLLRIERYRKHPKYGNGARILVDGSDSATGRYVKDSRKEAEKRFGFDYEVFSRAVILHSRMTESYASVKDRYLKQITEKLIGIPDFGPLVHRVVDSTRDTNVLIESSISEVQSILTVIKEKRKIGNEYTEKADKFDSEQAKIKASVEKDIRDAKILIIDLKNRISAEMKKSASAASRRKRIAERISFLRGKLSDYQDAREKIVSEIERAKAIRNLLVHQREIRRGMEGKICSTCGQLVPVGYAMNKAKESHEEFNEAVTKIQMERPKLSAADKNVLRVKRKIKSLSAVEERVREHDYEIRSLMQKLSAELDSARKDLRQAEVRLASCEKSNPYRVIVRDAMSSVNSQKKRLSSVRDKLEKRRRRLLYYEFWRKGFGPNGIRSFVMDAVTPVLNRIANIYLSNLMDGNMSVSLSTVKKKKDGDYSDRFSVEITNESGSSKLAGSCDNELHSLDLALNLAMTDVLGSRIPGGFGFLFVDQSVDLLDPVRGGKAIQLLRDKVNEKWCAMNDIPCKRSIWLITHRSELKDLIDQKIFVEKRNGVCRIAENS